MPEEQNLFLLKSPPSKVLAIYHAVNALMAEDRDMNHIRVSEITSRAGIGKGTAYEYFNNKEQMVSYALFYNMLQELEGFWKSVAEQRTFRDKIYGILDNVEKNFSKRKELCRYLDFYLQSMLTRRELMERVLHCPEFYGRIEVFAGELTGQAKAEGLIQEEPKTYFVVHTVATQILGYVYYLENQRTVKEVTIEEMRQFIYQNMLKMLCV